MSPTRETLSEGGPSEPSAAGTNCRKVSVQGRSVDQAALEGLPNTVAPIICSQYKAELPLPQPLWTAHSHVYRHSVVGEESPQKFWFCSTWKPWQRKAASPTSTPLRESPRSPHRSCLWFSHLPFWLLGFCPCWGSATTTTAQRALCAVPLSHKWFRFSSRGGGSGFAVFTMTLSCHEAGEQEGISSS